MLVALLVIAVTSALLLDRRVEVVQGAARARDVRTAWMLASQKLAELEMDPTLWTGSGSRSEGTFGDVDPAYAEFRWEVETAREPVPTNDPLKPGERPKEIMHLFLTVRGPALDEEPVRVEGLFPIQEPKP